VESKLQPELEKKTPHPVIGGPSMNYV
jgi:hypothetical protein